jgi:septum formation protein
VISLVLASGSPRRREILTTLRIHFDVMPSDADETRQPGEEPLRYVERVAEAKGREVFVRLGADGRSAAVLSADTVVIVDGDVFGKPADDHDAVRMLTALSGRSHDVTTAVVLLTPNGALSRRTVTSQVVFRTLTGGEIARYVASGEGRDKAGAYGIQGLAAALVSEVHGSYFNVVGLPAAETVALLAEGGVIGEWP